MPQWGLFGVQKKYGKRRNYRKQRNRKFDER